MALAANAITCALQIGHFADRVHVAKVSCGLFVSLVLARFLGAGLTPSKPGVSDPRLSSDNLFRLSGTGNDSEARGLRV
jgi:hypothetical protein